MRFSRGLSFPVVLIIGSIISTVLMTGILLIHFININHSPSIKNAERYLRQGRFDEALAFVSQIDSNSTKLSMLKAKIFFLKSLEGQKQNRWKNYGTDEMDWFKSEQIDSAIVLLSNTIGSGDEEFALEAHFYLGLIYSEKGWFYKSEKEFLEVLLNDPHNIATRLALSTVYVKTRNFSDAEKELRSGFKTQPKNPDVAKNMAYLYRYYIDLPESAMVWLNRYLNTARPRDLNINDAKIELDELLQRYPEYSPSEPQLWRERDRKFIPRKH